MDKCHGDWPGSFCHLRRVQFAQACWGVKLQVFTSLPTDMNVLTDSSIVIWVKMRHDGLPELAGHIVKVCRRYRLMRQLVISDAIPEGMTNDIGPLSRVWLTHGVQKWIFYYLHYGRC